jgi:hypothetical protein
LRRSTTGRPGWPTATKARNWLCSAKGLPCGSEAFIAKLKAFADRLLRFRPIGRPRTREEDENRELR